MLASLLGTRLTLWLGPTIAVPAPAPIVEALSAVEVTLNSEGRDGFQLTFTLGRGARDIVDYPLLANPLLRPFSRVIIQVWMGVTPEVLIDGFITNHQVNPGNEPGAATLTITGEDVRVMMDLRELSIPYPQMTPEARVALILLKYAFFLGAPPIIIPALTPDLPVILERIPAQSGTDLAYIQQLAEDVGYVFYVEPTPVPMVNLAYWGPENRLSIPQSALSANMGPDTNVTSFSSTYDALRPTTVLGLMQEKRTGVFLPVATFTSLRPPLAPLPAMLVQQPNVRSVLARNSGNLDLIQAYARAQALTDRSSDAVTAEGELDALQYGGLLRARRLVGVRGVGFLLDGFYYVKRVTHSIKKGEYKQSFSLVREGFGAIAPAVVP
jgi:hypothetical protein